MKKINKSNKLLLNKETVRNMTPSQMKAADGGAAYYDTTAANSAGATRPGPSHDTDFGANLGNIAVNIGAMYGH